MTFGVEGTSAQRARRSSTDHELASALHEPGDLLACDPEPRGRRLGSRLGFLFGQ